MNALLEKARALAAERDQAAQAAAREREARETEERCQKIQATSERFWRHLGAAGVAELEAAGVTFNWIVRSGEAAVDLSVPGLGVPIRVEAACWRSGSGQEWGWVIRFDGFRTATGHDVASYSQSARAHSLREQLLLCIASADAACRRAAEDTAKAERRDEIRRADERKLAEENARIQALVDAELAEARARLEAEAWPVGVELELYKVTYCTGWGRDEGSEPEFDYRSGWSLAPEPGSDGFWRFVDSAPARPGNPHAVTVERMTFRSVAELPSKLRRSEHYTATRGRRYGATWLEPGDERWDAADTCSISVQVPIAALRPRLGELAKLDDELHELMGVAAGTAPLPSAKPPRHIRLYMDGDQVCAVLDDFVNLQESPAGFGASIEEAVCDLAKAAANEAPERDRAVAGVFDAARTTRLALQPLPRSPGA